jgi:hypothetical protein
MARAGPRAGDFIIRSISSHTVGVFVPMADWVEHPYRAFKTYETALSFATRLAERLHTDVWYARGYAATVFRIAPLPPAA